MLFMLTLLLRGSSELQLMTATLNYHLDASDVNEAYSCIYSCFNHTKAVPQFKLNRSNDLYTVHFCTAWENDDVIEHMYIGNFNHALVIGMTLQAGYGYKPRITLV